MAVIEETIPPAALITPHTYRNDVWVHVPTGEIGVLVGEQTASRGQVRGRSRREASSTPCGGSERWFEETAALQSGDAEGFQASCQRHGIEFLPGSPWLQKLQERYRP